MEKVDSSDTYRIVEKTDEDTLKTTRYVVYYDISNNLDNLGMSFTEARNYFRENLSVCLRIRR